jgi:ketosteroid isomerase-like protein
MDAEARRELVESYFERVDAERYGDLEGLFTGDVAFHPPGDDITGVEEMIDWYRDRLKVADATHDVQRYVDDGTTVVCEGHLTGRLPDGSSIEGGFLDVFEFDTESERIAELTIYDSLG